MAQVAHSEAAYARVGSNVAGKYRLEYVLGSGGMGIVFAATHLKLSRQVALKLLLPRNVARAEMAERLVREARAAAALQSEHVVRVFDVDILECGSPYIVMEFLRGETLASRIRRRGPLTLARTIEYALQTCEALAEAHSLGIVHRDIKPPNLFLVAEPERAGSLRVLDFGACQKIDTTKPTLAARSSERHPFVGSPAYVSPEQLVRAPNVDARADIWALGVVLYECITGQVPFYGDTLPELWDSILLAKVPRFAEAARVPAAFEDIVRYCLEKAPQARCPSVQALARLLAGVAPPELRVSLGDMEWPLGPATLPLRQVTSRGASPSDPDRESTVTAIEVPWA